MKLLIDTELSLVRISQAGQTREYPLYSAEAFRALSLHWLAMGWNLEHWASFSWMGRQILQLPDDILRLAEYVWRTRPDVIIETGIFDGGSTLLFASLCRLMGHGRVISIDREIRSGVREAVSGEPVTLIEGDSADKAIALQVATLVDGAQTVCVFLDSDHSAEHVRNELQNYSPLVTPGNHIIVADSICAEVAHTPQGDRDWKENYPGKAVDDFIALHPEFERIQPEPLFNGSADFRCVSYFGSAWLRRR